MRELPPPPRELPPPKLPLPRVLEEPRLLDELLALLLPLDELPPKLRELPPPPRELPPLKLPLLRVLEEPRLPDVLPLDLLLADELLVGRLLTDELLPESLALGELVDALPTDALRLCGLSSSFGALQLTDELTGVTALLRVPFGIFSRSLSAISLR